MAERQFTLEEQTKISRAKKALFELAIKLAEQGRLSKTASEINEEIENMSDDYLLDFVNR
ncbi:MAG: hypothetical protein MJZ53_02475 [Paludibacteraceae bacterium]|nr:hypothetical protein [Paludibacteraceae bacterium]